VGTDFVFRHGYSHGPGVSSLIGTIAHAAIWSTVGRFIWHAPVVVVAACFVLGAFYLVFRRASR
jgi:hypothetical protein